MSWDPSPQDPPGPTPERFSPAVSTVMSDSAPASGPQPISRPHSAAAQTSQPDSHRSAEKQGNRAEMISITREKSESALLNSDLGNPWGPLVDPGVKVTRTVFFTRHLNVTPLLQEGTVDPGFRSCGTVL